MADKKEEYQNIIGVLKEFRDWVAFYAQWRYKSDKPDLSETRQKINKKIFEIKRCLEQANITTTISGRAPAVIGGYPFTLDLLSNMFENEGTWTAVNLKSVLDCLDRAIGFYEELVKTGRTLMELTPKQSLDIYKLIELKLRPMFKREPENETEVQDKIEDILNISNIAYKREKESLGYSTKSYIPDFTLYESRVAVEVKLCNSKNDEKSIIAEINDDILAYKTTYEICIFIVYDIGIIRDIQSFKGDFEKSDNVYIIVVKH